jgi:hypothetical protein
LTLVQAKLDAKFDSEPNGHIFRPDCQSKMALHPEILISPDVFAKNSVSGFAILSDSSLKVVGLNVELHSASNDTIFDQGYREDSFDEDKSREP